MKPEPGLSAGGEALGAPRRQLGPATASALVVASMIGVGVFTTAGFQARDLGSPLAILACWAVGGLAAWCGAVCYAELGAAMPENGGEYHFIARLLHPAVGFASAVCSFVVGFAAPTAMMASAFGSHLAEVFPGAPAAELSGSLLIVGSAVLHMGKVVLGVRVQNALTYGKVALILGFVVVGAAHGHWERLVAPGVRPFVATVLSPTFAVSLMYVSFSYSGWNAAAYMAGEVARPQRVLPIATLAGTFAVMLLYLALNAVFLSAAPLAVLAGNERVAHVAATHLFGDEAARWVSGLIAAGLLSTVGALLVTGPRIYAALGRDHARLRWLAARDPERGPRAAIVLQAVLAIALLATSGFEVLLGYVGFTLSIFSALGVACVFVRRHGRARGPLPYRMPLYPLPPVIFMALMAWMVFQSVREQPWVALAGVVTIASSLVLYALVGGRAQPAEGG